MMALLGFLLACIVLAVAGGGNLGLCLRGQSTYCVIRSSFFYIDRGPVIIIATLSVGCLYVLTLGWVVDIEMNR